MESIHLNAKSHCRKTLISNGASIQSITTHFQLLTHLSYILHFPHFDVLPFLKVPKAI